ncbi:uncharacterized protein LOC114756815 [Neltuma alba]|uniref:uncharacterized protein LOC114756815 n=1 Tax=Neltuma alba TaxID=207710 RepID=UPI0010A2BB1C|nr:uncharacterized protein LOC114756815 [Prosopis alba]
MGWDQGTSNCKLCLDQSFKHVVAVGVVYNNGNEILHNSPLPQNTLRVRIDVCTNEDAQLPFPTPDEQTMVKDVEGNGIQVEFDRHIYSTSDIFDNIDWHVLNDILYRGWVGVTTINIWISSARLSYSKTVDTSRSYVWKKIQCPFQPNNNDCGYYIMRFMKEIITHNQIFIPENCYEDARCTNYTNNQVNEVIKE